MKRRFLSNLEVLEAAVSLCDIIRKHFKEITHIYGVPRGGTHVAKMIANELKSLSLIPDEESFKRLCPTNSAIERDKILIVDDLIDSGETRKKFTGFAFFALFSKRDIPEGTLSSHNLWLDEEQAYTLFNTKVDPGTWLVFPWERDTEEAEGPTDAVLRLLEFVGEDPKREGLVDTPRRVVKALAEMTKGYHESPSEILSTSFEEKYDEMVIVRDIPFWSLCEHHIMPFHGTASIGYLPRSRIIGLSKIPRLVRCFARRLQVQERLTTNIAEALYRELSADGVGVIVRAQHTCMQMRGVECLGEMVTSCLLGSFHQPGVREEFLRLTRSSRLAST